MAKLIAICITFFSALLAHTFRFIVKYLKPPNTSTIPTLWAFWQMSGFIYICSTCCCTEVCHRFIYRWCKFYSLQTMLPFFEHFQTLNLSPRWPLVETYCPACKGWIVSWLNQKMSTINGEYCHSMNWSMLDMQKCFI